MSLGNPRPQKLAMALKQLEDPTNGFGLSREVALNVLQEISESLLSMLGTPDKLTALMFLENKEAGFGPVD